MSGPVSKMGFRKKVQLAVIFFLIIIIVLSALFFYSTYFLPSLEKNVVVDIPRGIGLSQIALHLEESGVIKNEKLFVLFVFLKGAQNRLKAGEYEFRSGDSMNQIIEKLIKGDVVVRKITIPEGLTMDQIAELLDANGVMSGDDFMEKAKSIVFARGILGDSVASFEGYLFPDTYSYTKGITPEELIMMMTSRFKRVYESLGSGPLEQRLTEHEIVTLASIIEKETGDDSERPLISAVFYNRLRLGMRLESDPTVIYGLGRDFDGNLRKEHLTNEASSYNTYRTAGLPPGPIANPGKESLWAALHPARVNYVYFVSKGDGTHYFSSDYRDHREAVLRYQNKTNRSY
jgi:UPF0755 protein